MLRADLNERALVYDQLIQDLGEKKKLDRLQVQQGLKIVHRAEKERLEEFNTEQRKNAILEAEY